jgi:hypothetical protein
VSRAREGYKAGPVPRGQTALRQPPRARASLGSPPAGLPVVLLFLPSALLLTPCRSGVTPQQASASASPRAPEGRNMGQLCSEPRWLREAWPMPQTQVRLAPLPQGSGVCTPLWGRTQQAQREGKASTLNSRRHSSRPHGVRLGVAPGCGRPGCGHAGALPRHSAMFCSSSHSCQPRKAGWQGE